MKTLIKIAIASGKGGVGKSMLTSSLLMLFAKDKRKVIAVDCDADAPNLAIWLGEPKNWDKVKKISVSEKPAINNNALKNMAGKAEECVKKCRFGALRAEKEKLKLNPFLCEGCGACEFFCPAGTIKMKPVKNGEIKTKKTKYGFPLISGQLYPGETGSGKIVTEVKREAEKFNGDIMLIDSAPGTGCPVIASLQNADFVLLIAEPTPSGFSDAKRVLEVIEHFKIPWSIVINKYDINFELSDKIKKWASQKGQGQINNKFLGEISYDKNIPKSISNLVPIMETDLEAKNEIKKIYSRLRQQYEQR